MAPTVKEIMTRDPVTLAPTATVREAARQMRERDIGNVLVADGNDLRGIVTDRDIVVRGLAERDDLSDCHLSDVCSDRVVTADPNEDAEETIRRMRQNSIRRIAVVEQGKPVGVLSLGDAAMEEDPNSALGEISSARGNQ